MSRRYGGRGEWGVERNTIHATEFLDVEVDKKGRVIQVWFRCQMLPFEQHEARDREFVPNAALPSIVAVELADRRRTSGPDDE